MLVFDVIIIGAGIHGAAVAREASAQGLKVAVLEQFDAPAKATSCKSSKLIHGGLRYLESKQFHLVYECLREQKCLLRTAPHLVSRSEFAIPILPRAKRPAWLVQLGLYAYWFLGGARPKRLALDSADKDGLRTTQFNALLSYHDAQTDDAQLTRAVLASAISMGTVVRFEACCESIEVQPSSATVSFRQNNAHETWCATTVINASGPWVNQILQRVAPPQKQLEIEWVRGSHIELPGPLSRCYYVEAPDGRAVFVLPWKGHRLIGTTERIHNEIPENPVATAEEINYLLETYNRYFSPACQIEQLIDSWAGLRVLPAAKQSPFSRARDAILLTDRPNQPRLISIYGGKLTSHRATAERVVTQLMVTKNKLKIDTRRQVLPDLNSLS